MIRFLVTILVVFSVYIGSRGQTFNNADTLKSSYISQYEKLRNLAFSIQYTDLHLELPLDTIIVYGTIMDWRVEENVATVIALSTGDASVYLKSGQIFVGGYAHDKIAVLAKSIVRNSQVLIPKTVPFIDNEYPEKHSVKFYLLTNRGILVHGESENSIKDIHNEWSKLFKSGNMIINDFRLLSNP